MKNDNAPHLLECGLRRLPFHLSTAQGYYEPWYLQMEAASLCVYTFMRVYIESLQSQ